MTKKSRTYPKYDDMIAERFAKDPEFLQLCLEKSFNNYNETGNIFFLRETLKQAAQGKGMTKLAAETGLSRQYLYKMVSDKGNPTITTLNKVLESFGFRAQINLI